MTRDVDVALPEEPPRRGFGLAEFLMALGAASLSFGAGLFMTRSQLTLSPAAATLLLKALPVVVGGGLVVLGAAIRRLTVPRAMLGSRPLERPDASLPAGRARRRFEGPRS